MLGVTKAAYISNHKIWLQFNDGIEGEVDLSDQLDGEVFAPLKDPNYFSAFSLHPELHTVTWPTGADFAPEFLHNLLRRNA